jgi:hypothetical protein
VKKLLYSLTGYGSVTLASVVHGREVDSRDYVLKSGFCADMTAYPNFKISPVAVAPQTGRRGRIILDLSFPVRRESKKRRRNGHPLPSEIVQASVNKTTIKLAPEAAVKAIGQVLPRLFQFMVVTPEEEVISFSKIDLSVGFWRMIVEEDQQWKFCCVMPDLPCSPVCIVVPSTLQMGWAESPPYFCSATEVGRVIIE